MTALDFGRSSDKISFALEDAVFRAFDAGWSSPVAREAHNLEVTGSNPVPATLRKSCRNLELSYLPAVGSAA